MTIVLDARTATPHFPGIGRYVTNLARALPRVAPSESFALIGDADARDLNLPAIACAASPFSLSQQWRVPRLLRQARASVYHSAYYVMPYVPGAPTVLTCYDVIPLVYPAYFSALQRLAYRWLNHLALRAARRVLVISEATRRDVQKYFGVAPEKMIVTPLAADPAFVPASAEHIAAVRAKFSLPAEYVLYLGSNKPHKNLATLLRAMGKIATPLVIAGAYDARYPIASHNAQTIFLRDVAEADLPALYSGARAFVFPSLYEGFGLPPLEAMACGAPVICANTSSLPEVVGDAALLVNPRDANEIADAIERVLTNPALRDELRAKGLAQAQKFSWERTARLTYQVYQEIMGRR